MRRFWLFISIIGVFLFIAAGVANATTIGFGDSANAINNPPYWTGWASTDARDNSKDTLGTPDIFGGSVIVDGSQLTSVSIQYHNFYEYTNMQSGDLFINLIKFSGDDYWDYVVDTDAEGKNIYPFGDTQFALGSYNPDNPYYYELSDSTWGSGSGIRNNHPVLYKGGLSTTLEGTASITPTSFDYSVGDKTFTYSELDLPLTALNGEYSFIIGWTVSCANDVIYEKINTPVPAPTTILLVGSGLLGLVAFVRKRRTP